MAATCKHKALLLSSPNYSTNRETICQCGRDRFVVPNSAVGPSPSPPTSSPKPLKLASVVKQNIRRKVLVKRMHIICTHPTILSCVLCSLLPTCAYWLRVGVIWRRCINNTIVRIVALTMGKYKSVVLLPAVNSSSLSLRLVWFFQPQSEPPTLLAVANARLHLAAIILT